jgi:hypothetical protein
MAAIIIFRSAGDPTAMDTTLLYWDAIGFVHLPSDPLDPLIDVAPELN